MRISKGCADFVTTISHPPARFTPKSGHGGMARRCLQSGRSGHRATYSRLARKAYTHCGSILRFKVSGTTHL